MTRIDPDIASGELELAIGGMTCVSCANRVERKLNKMAGVSATVNYATERATVTFPAGVTEADLVATVEAAGYTATAPQPEEPDRTRGCATPAGRRRRARGAGDRALDGAGGAVRRLAVGVARPRHAGGALGRPAVPSGGMGEPAARHRDDGHADLDGHARRVPLVRLRAGLRYRGRDRHGGRVQLAARARRPDRHHLPRDGGGGDRIPARRAVRRGAGEASLGRRAEGTASARREGCRGAPGRR